MDSAEMVFFITDRNAQTAQNVVLCEFLLGISGQVDLKNEQKRGIKTLNLNFAHHRIVKSTLPYTAGIKLLDTKAIAWMIQIQRNINSFL
jgi:hypothetical protein